MSVDAKKTDQRASLGNFRHSVFINNTFDFLDDFDDETKEGCCNGLEENHIQSSEQNRVSNHGNSCFGKPGVNGNCPGIHVSTESVVRIKETSVGCDDSFTLENGRNPTEDRRRNQIIAASTSNASAFSRAEPAPVRILSNCDIDTLESTGDGVNDESSQEPGPQVHSPQIDGGMPGCHGYQGVGDELKMGALCGSIRSAEPCSYVQETMCFAGKVRPSENIMDLSSSLLSDGPITQEDKENDKRKSDTQSAEKSVLSGDVTTSSVKFLNSGEKLEVCAMKNVDLKKSCDTENVNVEYCVNVVTAEDCDVVGAENNSGSPGEETCSLKNDRFNHVKNIEHPADETNRFQTTVESHGADLPEGVKEAEESSDYGTDSCDRLDANSSDDVESEISYKGSQSDYSTSKPTVDNDLECNVKVVMRRSRAHSPSRCSESSSRGTSEDEDDDEDAGVYAETHRYSKWMYAGDDAMQITPINFEDVSGGEMNTEPERIEDDVEEDALLDDPDQAYNRDYRRLESLSSTASEKEFKRRYQYISRKVVRRKSSLQAYERMSERFCEPERHVLLEKVSTDQDFGFHLKGSQPAYVSTVKPSSIAQQAGIQVGEIIVSVNGINTMGATHDEVIELILKESNRISLELSKSGNNMEEGTDEPIKTGYLLKQGGSGLLKTWRRRYCILKRDHCLYYYKSEMDKDPTGALLLCNYSIKKASDVTKKNTFKAVKYGAKTYYFSASSEQEMVSWANVLNESAKSAGRTDTWLDISSPNVDVPALSIKNPDCHGNLSKLGVRRRVWRRRYCVLKDACLYYYLDLSATTAQGVAHLHGYRVLDSAPQNRKFTFTLQPPEEKMRTFYFSTDNETDMNRWITALSKSINRWVKAD